MIYELHYSNTNTYLIKSGKKSLIFDTGWAGSFDAFCRTIGKLDHSVKDIDYILISHYHPDHMGIAQQIANEGAVILVADVQKDFIHSADVIFAKEKNRAYIPIDDEKIKIFSTENSREFLSKIGLNGEVIYTPGHSTDSISLLLDDGSLFVGDLNPLYELEAHKDTEIEESWNKLLSYSPKTVYYGHAKTAVLDTVDEPVKTNEDMFILVQSVMRYIDKGYPLEKIIKKTGASKELIDDITRMYLTHTNVGVQGILDRIEIKNK